ncbi:hypothetical protein O6H91_Y144400 [Diphasiastrum complanatum]|nr:hypothetical protein O6H91_Y144400 [Diphasiastrum complanatum]
MKTRLACWNAHMDTSAAFSWYWELLRRLKMKWLNKIFKGSNQRVSYEDYPHGGSTTSGVSFSTCEDVAQFCLLIPSSPSPVEIAPLKLILSQRHMHWSKFMSRL